MMKSDAKYHLFNKLIINYKRGVAGNIVRKPGYIIGWFKLRNRTFASKRHTPCKGRSFHLKEITKL